MTHTWPLSFIYFLLFYIYFLSIYSGCCCFFLCQLRPWCLAVGRWRGGQSHGAVERNRRPHAYYISVTWGINITSSSFFFNNNRKCPYRSSLFFVEGLSGAINHANRVFCWSCLMTYRFRLAALRKRDPDGTCSHLCLSPHQIICSSCWLFDVVVSGSK